MRRIAGEINMLKNDRKDNYQLLIAKLDQFIRKYYKNQMLRGAIWALSVLIASFLIVTLLEYIGHFGTVTRGVLFYLYLLVNAGILIYFILIPLSKLYRIGKVISHHQAAQIIGKHFQDVNDKLLNTLQLRGLTEINAANRDLIEASINQRSKELSPVPFSSAVNFLDNRKYLKYLIIPLLILLSFMVGKPEIIRDSSMRVVKHKMQFEKPLPFEFSILNDSLNAIKNEDFTLQLKIDGETLPERVAVVFNGQEHYMDRYRADIFEYTFKKVRSAFDFNFRINQYSTRDFELNVLPKPVLTKFDIELDYPDYIGKEDEKLENTGDLTIPEGTRVSWRFYTEDTKKLYLTFKDQNIKTGRQGKEVFTYQRSFFTNNQYSVNTQNDILISRDSIYYFINIIPDAFPRILVQQEKDSFSSKYLFFTGEISDDYGLKKLTFNYKFTESEDSSKLKNTGKINIQIAAGKNLQSFMHSYDLKNLDIKAGEVVEYYFEVWDNDGVNGSKSTRSERFYFEAPSLKEVEQKSEQLSSDVKEEMKNAAKKAKEIQKDLEKAREKMLEKKKLTWEDKQFIDDVMDKQKKLQEDLKKIKDKYIENVTTKDEYSEIKEEILEKYEQLYEMFNEVMPKEIQELYEEMEKLMQENMKDDIQEELEEMKMDNDELEKELDRMLELFKQLEFEQKTNEVIDKLDELAEKQEKLAEETENKDKENEQLQEEQERLNEDFKDIQEDMKKLEDLNEELENPREMEEFEEENKEIKEEQNQSLENLKMNKQKKSSKNQRNAAKKMKEVSEKMKSMKMEMEMQQMQINYQKLRQILENLVYLSLEQEKLMDDFKDVTSYNPKFVQLAQYQQKLRNDAVMIEDSLYALSKEVPQISSYINKELIEVNYNLDKTIALLAERKTAQARAKQQYIMTSVNNIAVLLSEILQNMQEQMSMMSSDMKGQSKKKGKGNKPSISDLKKLQDELNKDLENLKKGKLPGKKMSKQMARMAARQEMIRNAIRKIEEEKMKGGGKKPGGNLPEIQELMEETEKDIVNKRITPETIKRQKEISVKLLEAEKAEKKQDEDKKRESKTARDIFRKDPPSLEEYNKRKEKEVELLQTVPPALNPYFRIKVKEYFRQLPK